jgi:exopolysaccharide production protein ExoQ
MGFSALLGGAGFAYAPVPTFAAVAVIFVVGLRSFTGVSLPYPAKTRASEGVRDLSSPRGPLSTRLVSGYLLVWWLALIAPILAYSPREGSSTGVAQAAAQGSLRNQVLIVSFGLVGALFFPAAIRRLDPAFRWVVALWTLYLCWASASLLWSVYPLLTLRSVVAFVLISVGTFGLSAGFYGGRPDGRNLFLRHVFVAGILSALVVLLPLPFRWGQYNLLDPAGRLEIGGDFSTYVSRPALCALLILLASPILGVRRWRARDWFWLAFLLLPLLALKTRGPALWAMLTLGIFYLLYRSRVQDRILQIGMLVVISLGAYLGYSEGVISKLVPYLTRGNVEGTLTLTGRVPLWEVLISELGQHPWIGAGFAAFWSPDNLYRIEQLTGFSATSSHNGFVEEVLNTGLVGLAILLAFFVHITVLAGRHARRGDPFGWLVLLFLIFYLLLNLTNALIQDYLQLPFLILLALLGLMASTPATGRPASSGAPGMPRVSVAHHTAPAVSARGAEA